MKSTVHIDISCSQDAPNVERGIPTFARELCFALSEVQSKLEYSFVLNAEESLNSSLDDLINTGKVIYSGTEQANAGADIFLDISPFYRSGLARFKISENYKFRSYLVHDLIPFIYPQHYLRSNIVKARHLASREFIRQADLLLTNSRWTEQDVCEILKISPRRVVNIGTGTAARFSPPTHKLQGLVELQVQFPNLRSGFLMYTGGSDWRKNIESLVRAYSLLPTEFRAQHQLVLSYRIETQQQSELWELIDSLGVSKDVIVTGYVPDPVLVSLYQSAELLVFPSVYEGYGLPVAEAVACGTPAIVADNSSLIELVPDIRGRFNIDSLESIAQAIHTVVNDVQLQEELLTKSRSALTSWEVVAHRANSALEKLVA